MSFLLAGQHMPAGWLSAYLDDELNEPDSAKVAAHLAECTECREEFSGMRSLAGSLQGLDSVAPAPSLNQWVVRRVAFEGQQSSLMERIEERLEIFTRQSTSLFYLSMVISLGAIVWLFSWGLERHQADSKQMSLDNIPHLRTGEILSEETMVRAGRGLSWTGRQWVEVGVTQAEAANVLWGTPDADELVAANIELADLFDLAQPVMIIVDGRTLRLRHPPSNWG